jgi:aflatoxin B1 aldehyde reductase
MMTSYRRRYWNDLFFESIKKMEATVKEHNLTLVESALRWITHHSGLGPNDGIVIGASSLDHLESNLNDLEKGPLPQEVVDAFDEAWEHVRVACPPYFKDVESAIFISSASQKDE